MARVMQYKCDRCGKQFEAPAFVPEGYDAGADPNVKTWFQVGSRLVDVAGKAKGLTLQEACSIACATTLFNAMRDSAAETFVESLQPGKPSGLDLTIRTILIFDPSPPVPVAAH